MKKFFIATIVLFILVELGLFFTDKWYLNNLFAKTIFSGKTGPDIDELHLFSNAQIKTASPQSWAKSSHYNQYVLNDSLLKAINDFETVAFVVIKNDSLLFEKYWEDYHDSSLINSFSMAKSITSILIGCAIKDGLIKSVDEPVGNYLHEFETPALKDITIKNLLTMSSGLNFEEGYSSPLSWPAEAYYGPDVNALTIKQSSLVHKPGTLWMYKGGDTQLLGMILKKVTGKNIAQYATEKLWDNVNAEYPAYWSLDDQNMEKVSCCWYANAKDFARIAKLMMQKGNWNGTQLLDSTYVNQSLTPCNIKNTSGETVNYYGYQWWLLQYKGHDVFYARGIRGQYIFAIPDLNTIVVRLGHKRAPKTGDEAPADVFVYLDAALQMQ